MHKLDKSKLDRSKLEATGNAPYSSGWRRVADAEYFEFLVAKLLLLGAKKITGRAAGGYALVDMTGIGVQQSRNTILNCQHRVIPSNSVNMLINTHHYDLFIKRVTNGQT